VDVLKEQARHDASQRMAPGVKACRTQHIKGLIRSQLPHHPELSEDHAQTIFILVLVTALGQLSQMNLGSQLIAVLHAGVARQDESRRRDLARIASMEDT